MTALRPLNPVLARELRQRLRGRSAWLVITLYLVILSLVVGGVGGTEVLRGMAMVVASAITLAALATMCSSLARRTQGATVLAYGVTLFLIFGTFVLFGAQLVATRTPTPRASKVFLVM